MNIASYPSEIVGFLSIAGGVQSRKAALAIKAVLEDLPGVRGVEIAGDTAHVRFDPALLEEPQLYRAVKRAGFRAASFAALAVH